MEIALVVTIVLSFALISASVIKKGGEPLTREEAIAISKTSPIVQTALSEAGDKTTLKVKYYSAEYIRSWAEKSSDDVLEKLPRDHGVWLVYWINDAPGWRITHYVDELTGKILYESWFLSG
jgi:RNA-splicing ligase RtcB